VGLFSKVRQSVQDYKNTEIPAPDGSWVKTRAEYKAAEKRVKGK
jgi:hypothetical protein